MLSRVAGSIYWMSRYLERAENVARFIDVNAYLMLDLSLDQSETQWSPLVDASGDEADFYARYKNADEASVVRFLTFDRRNNNSISASIEKARENARTVREIIPGEMWELINELYHFTQTHSRNSLSDLQAFSRKIRHTGHFYSGLMQNTMSRDQGFWFAHLGQMLERADKTLRIMDVKYFLLLPKPEMINSAYDIVQWGAVLKSISALEMYRQQFHSINYHDVAQFAFFSTNFPRSLAYCVHSVSRALGALNPLGRHTEAGVVMDDLLEMLKEAETETLVSSGLHEMIDLVQLKLNALDVAIARTYFR